MSPVSTSVLAALSFRRQPTRPSKKLLFPIPRPPTLPVFIIAPHRVYNAFAMMAAYEHRQIRQPLIKLKTFVSRTIQESLLTAAFHLLTRSGSGRGKIGRDKSLSKKPRRCRVEARRNWERAVELERELDLEGAIHYLERAIALQPENPKYLGLLSKQYTDKSFTFDVSPQESRELNQKAIEIADRLVSLNPSDPIGHIARGVSKGRLAYYSNPREKIELAREAEDSVRDALDLDQRCDIGHHLMGRFHYEMAGLNVLCRAVVRVVYGQTMSPGSYEEALKEFEIANRLNPERLIHKIQLGKTHMKLGNKRLAIESLQAALEMNVTDINDHLEHLDGTELLRKLKQEA